MNVDLLVTFVMWLHGDTSGNHRNSFLYLVLFSFPEFKTPLF